MPPLLFDVINERNAHLQALHTTAMHTIASCSSAASLLAVGEWEETDDDLLERWAAMTQQLLEQAQEVAAMGQLWHARAKSARCRSVLLGRPVPPASTSCVVWSDSPPHWCSSPPIYTGSWSMAATVAQRPGVVVPILPPPGTSANRPDLLPPPPRFEHVPPQQRDFAAQTVNLANSPWWHHNGNTSPTSLLLRPHGRAK